MLAAQAGDKKDGLDEETLERWRRYLGHARKEHPFLDKWSGLMEKNARPANSRRRGGVRADGRQGFRREA